MHVHSGPRASTNPSGVLKISSLVTLAYIVLLVIAGFRAHSLALLAEAGHNLSDFRSEEHTSELQSRFDLVCRLLLEKKNTPSLLPSTTLLLHPSASLPSC